MIHIVNVLLFCYTQMSADSRSTSLAIAITFVSMLSSFNRDRRNKYIVTDMCSVYVQVGHVWFRRFCRRHIILRYITVRATSATNICHIHIKIRKIIVFRLKNWWNDRIWDNWRKYNRIKLKRNHINIIRWM